ncbi:type II toxin-antitoxin system VapB family antitoxin [Pararhizobium sp. LjRoot238]|uniref:type II toxin-antitoxin system VapB family antitoxin n=1 Tax=Pararhizobium sp. LjRoot238 TaxID=3342293 RepID=UPI003ECEB6A0
MPINVTNEQADTLTRKFARLENVSITDAIVIAMREAIERRLSAETPLQTAARLRAKHGVNLSADNKKPLPKEAFDEMWERD